MKPHEYLRMVLQFRTKTPEQCTKEMALLSTEERKELQKCMLEFMRFMIDLDSDDAESPKEDGEAFVRALFKKNNL